MLKWNTKSNNLSSTTYIAVRLVVLEEVLSSRVGVVPIEVSPFEPSIEPPWGGSLRGSTPETVLGSVVVSFKGSSLVVPSSGMLEGS